MQPLETIVAEHEFFRGLPGRYVELVASCASNVRFNVGDFLFREGEEADRFYLIRQGSVSLEIFHPSRGSITMQTLKEGDVLGWSWLIPPYKWFYDARAMELTRAIALNGTCLRAKCEEDHDLGYEFMKRFSDIIVQRLQATRLQLLDMYGIPS